jgi:hypothetical protein
MTFQTETPTALEPTQIALSFRHRGLALFFGVRQP